jgi:hypothetical protein
MAKRSGSGKRLEALMRAQKMNELLQIGGIQSQALLDSAGETRPSDESHVTELLDSERFRRADVSGSRSKKSRPARQLRRKSGMKRSSSKKARR